MVIIAAFFITTFVLNTTTVPTVCLVSSGYEPQMEIPEDVLYHAFLSHVWNPGHGKTHAIVRKLQLHLPEVKIWLDVDDLEDIGAPEKSITKCVIVIIFYSKDYFVTRDCQRELYVAVEQKKPMIILHDDNITM